MSIDACFVLFGWDHRWWVFMTISARPRELEPDHLMLFLEVHHNCAKLKVVMVLVENIIQR
jgi:hypothetical protein